MDLLFIFYFGLKPNLEENNEIEKIKIPEKNILIYGLYMFIFMGTVMALVDWAPLWFERELLTTSLIASLTIVSWSGGETIGKFLGAKL